MFFLFYISCIYFLINKFIRQYIASKHKGATSAINRYKGRSLWVRGLFPPLPNFDEKKLKTSVLTEIGLCTCVFEERDGLGIRFLFAVFEKAKVLIRFSLSSQPSARCVFPVWVLKCSAWVLLQAGSFTAVPSYSLGWPLAGEARQLRIAKGSTSCGLQIKRLS